MVIWITGLPNAGKTTFAKELTLLLRQRGKVVVHLDGDELRRILGVEGEMYQYEDRKKLAGTYGDLAAHLASQGLVVIVSTVSLFHSVQEKNRNQIHPYVEVLLTGREAELQARGRSYASPLPKWGKELPPQFPVKPEYHFELKGLDEVSAHVATIANDLLF